MAGMAWDWTAGDPVLNINRDPRWGRHGEGGTEDGMFFSKIIQPWKVAGKDAVRCYLDYLGCKVSPLPNCCFFFSDVHFCCHYGRIELVVGKGLRVWAVSWENLHLLAWDWLGRWLEHPKS